jgi:hypothetical protein
MHAKITGGGNDLQPNRCDICRRRLDNPLMPDTRDLGGTCLLCMAEAGDPEALAAYTKLVDEKRDKS